MIHRYNGAMTDVCDKLYTAGQVRGIDYAAIHQFGIAGYDLMCRAGAAAVKDALAYFPASKHWLLMCGPGNNGGDGYVIARLAVEAGIKVTVCSTVDPALLENDAAQACADWQKSAGTICEWPLSEDHSFDLAIDALLGTGIDRDVGGIYRQAIDFINNLDCPTLAIDIPSGLNADTGCPMGCAVEAQRTVTFVGRKRGMYTADGPDFCGPITFDDLGIPHEASLESTGQVGALLSSGFLREVLHPRLLNSHKGSFGHVLAVGGIKGMSGAIRLCGEAALRCGAGRVTLLTDSAHAALVNLNRPELMVKGVDGDIELLDSLDGNFVVAVGPGLGGSAWSESLLNTCLESGLALVVDADGLNILSNRLPHKNISRGNWILTPHPAEAARLLDSSVRDVQQDRIQAATLIAHRFDCCVVLKGCGTIVADSTGEYVICPAGNPGMATAGSGDVLTGIIVALLAQGLSCFDAAKAGVWAHARAGDLAVEKTGQMAMIAGDILDNLPQVWNSAGL